LLRLRTKPRNKTYPIVTLALFISICLASASYGSTELIVGINNQPDHMAKGVISSYRTSDILEAQSEITVFVSSEYIGKTNIMLAIIAENSLVPQVNGQSAQQIQNSSNPLLAENLNPPYYLWNIENLSGANSDWVYAFKYENIDYYATSLSLDGVDDKCYVRVFIDNDNDFYYSMGDIVSGLPGPAKTAFGDNSEALFNMIINDESELIITKAYDGDDENEVITGTAPYLLVDGVQIDPIADFRHDVLITPCDGVQTWTLLKEYTNWRDVNILGYYSDPGYGDVRTTIFEGPRNEGYTFETNITDQEPIGLWFLNDVNGDTIYNGNDSWLFSERFLTRSSFANEHQWFMVYDVSAYKELGSTYEFICPTEDFTNTGDFDYLVYIDDDHTSANWDHNDMIFGVSCSTAPDSCGNYPPGAPPTYFMVDTTNFMGVPALPLPPPDSGGTYIYYDTTNCFWTIASHIYSGGGSLEQFHGSIVSIMSEPPELGLNVFISNFELWEDTTSNRCLFQNDRWGWSLWDSTLGLYEIWWDVTTKEYKHDAGDVNDFLTVDLKGSAVDFNVWSSGHVGGFDATQIYLGENMIRLSDIPGYTDFGGFDVMDQYQAAVGTHPDRDPNTSVFSTHCGPGESYNVLGQIDELDSYVCDADYGLNFSGAKVYQADGLQFSTYGAYCEDPCDYNNPPVCDLADDQTFLVCDDTTFSFYVTAFDPDENLVGCTKLSGSGSYYNEYWTFTTSGPGVYGATFECVDYCGATCTGTINITVNYNTPPTAVCPGNQTKFVCDSQAEICIPGFGYSDPEDNVVSVEVLGCDIHQDTVCFVPEGSSKTITYIVTDACGAADTCETVITLNNNQPPSATCPNDTTLFVCNLNDICLDGFISSDPDNNITSRVVDNGTLTGTEVCFTPVEGLNTITYTVTDECGATDQCMTNVTVTLNRPPVATCPDNSAMLVGNLDPICIDGFIGSDLDNNIVSKVVDNGILTGTEVCFTPVEGLNTITFTVTDACGATNQCVTNVNVSLNHPPVAHGPFDDDKDGKPEPIDTVIFVCELTQICLDGFYCTDPDDNLQSCEAFGGNLTGTEVCFTPVEGLNTITLIATDDFGLKDTSITTSNVVLNTPPTAVCPGNQTKFVCDSQAEICIPGFSYSDPEDNVVSVEVLGCDIHQDTVCFTPEGSSKTITYIVTDACGAADTCETIITLNNNQPPTVNCPNDTTIFVCDYSEICLPGFIYSDPNDNIETVEIIGCEIFEDTVCFTPDGPTKTITLIVTDECGAADTCMTNVNIVLNSPPVAEIFGCSISEWNKIPGPLLNGIYPNVIKVGATYHMFSTNQNYQIRYSTSVDGLNWSTPQVVLTAGQNGQFNWNAIRPGPVLYEDGAFRLYYNANNGSQWQVVGLATTSDPLNLSSWQDHGQVLGIGGPGEWDSYTIGVGGILKEDDGSYKMLYIGNNAHNAKIFTGLALSSDGLNFYKAVGVNPVISPTSGSYDNQGIYQPAGFVKVGNQYLCYYSAFIAYTPGYQYQQSIALATSSNCTTWVKQGEVLTLTEAWEGTGGLAWPSVINDNGTLKMWYCKNILPEYTDGIGLAIANCEGELDIFQCSSGEICIPAYCSDPDDNLTACNLLSGSGYYNDGNICFTPSGPGSYSFSLEAIDECNVTDYASLTINIEMNSPPSATCPNNTTLFVCNLNDICIDGFIATDPDDNITSRVVDNGTLTGTEVCFTPVEGLNTIMFTVTDACGATDQCVTQVTVTLNRPPTATCPPNSNMLVSNLDPICIDGFIGSDPDNNIVSESVDNGTLTGTEVCFTPVEGLNTITFTVTDACGATDQCVTEVTVTLNNPPVCHVPNDTTIFQCAETQVCLPVSCTDIDGNLASGYPAIVSSPGVISGGDWCYTPSGNQTVSVTIRCQDTYGEFCEDTFNVTFDINEPPICGAPNDTTIFQCTPTEVCLPISCSDIDGNLASGYPAVVLGSGVISGGDWCYTPSGDEAVAVTIRCEDDCGAYCEETFNVTFDINAAPVCNVPNDTTIFQCTAAQVCLPVSCSDDDDNLASGCPIKVSGPGAVAGGNWCYTPSGDEAVAVTIRCEDDCGAFCEETFNVTFDINAAPTCGVPNDTTIFQCTATEVCLPVTCSDIDGNLASGYPAVVSGSGVISGGDWCYTPSGDGAVAVTIRCQDDCGALCEETFNVTFDINAAPVCSVPNDTTIFQCAAAQVCLPVSCADIDGNRVL